MPSRRRRALLLSALAFVLALCIGSGVVVGRITAAVNKLPAGVVARRDIRYANSGGKPQLLDLYLPKRAEKPLPVVMWVHGGGWSSGSKALCPAVFLAERGYAVASIDYRLSDEATFPAQIFDCKAAVRWLRSHSKDYGLDPARIGVWGASAGGHLAALVGTSGGVRQLEGTEGNLRVSSRVQAVCDWFGPADFVGARESDYPEVWRRWQGAGAVEKLLGGPIEKNMGKARLASPVTFVTKDDPPFLIMHGDKDRLVPLRQSRVLDESLRRAGVQSTLRVVRGEGHGFGGEENLEMVAEFFDTHLRTSATERKEAHK